MNMLARLLIVLAATGSTLPLATQAAAPVQAAAEAQSETAPSALPWEGLPFSSLSDYENKIPVGMSLRDLKRILGNPETVMAGQGNDQVYHFLYDLADGRQIRAVIVVRKGSVFIRRLYVGGADGKMRRVE